MTSRHQFAPGVAVVALAVAMGAWSCGGSSPTESLTSPAAVQTDDSGGTVTASGAGKVTICHKGRELQVSANAIGGHVGHGDRVGSCTATCPCFTSGGIDSLAAQCTATLLTQCGQPYSIALMFCVPSGGSGGASGSLGSFEAILGSNTCTATVKNTQGTWETTTLPVTPAEYEACKQAIVGSTAYPGSCPR
jgi:hypothetical protein